MIKRKKKNFKEKVSNIGKKKTRSTKKSIILSLILLFILFVIICFTLFAAYIVIKAPEFNPDNLKYKQMSIVYDKDGNVIAKLGSENRTEITYDEVPEVLLDAIIATEDSKFFEHNGFDLPRFLVAAFKQATRRGGGGASTLTMQIVKNNYTSTNARGFEGITRKFTDIYMAVFKVEKKYTKKEIIEFYVNDSYLGNGAYGVEQASRNYFDKNVSELNLAEASFIAGLFQSPTYYNPYNYPDRAEKRRQTVLNLMKRHGYITEEERQIASSVPIKDLVIKTKVDTTGTNIYQGYIDTVIEELDEEYNLSPYTTPLYIYTAMDKSKQDFVNKVMNGQAWKWENNLVQAGIVMSDSRTGEVKAVGAGRNKNTQLSFNYATMTNRQIGSTAKPIFDYGPAVEYLGWGSANYILDGPWTYTGGKRISNSDGGYRGNLPLYQALGLSRNITALKTFQQVSKQAGNDKIVEFATKLGVTPELDANGKAHEAHSIGSFIPEEKDGNSKNSPMTMAGAYGAFSNGGTYIKPHTIVKYVYKETGETVTPNIEKHKAMDPATAFIISYSLRWSATSGLARRAANISGVEVAAKTGTTNVDYNTLRKKGISSNHVNDLWVCGYTPSEVITFWYGYDHLTKEHYSTTATWTTRDLFYHNLAQNLFTRTGEAFKVPNNVIQVSVVPGSDPLRKAAAGGVPGYFRKGTEPTEYGVPESTVIPNVTNLKSSANGRTITITWNGLTADQILALNGEEGYGGIVYQIYVKDGASGSNRLLATTSKTSYTDTTTYDNPIYTVYTTYENNKNLKSSGVSTSQKFNVEFSVTPNSCEINVGEDASTCSRYLIVTSAEGDVTDESTITITNNGVNNAVVGTYSITYSITYKGTKKTITQEVTVKE